MTIEQILQLLAVVISVLTIGLTALGGYLGYLTHTLEGRLRTQMERRLSDEGIRLDKRVAARLALLDAALDVMAIGERNEQRRELLYLLRHVARLGSGDDQEVRKSLAALEAVGELADSLLPYVERVRAASDWAPDCETMFEDLLRTARSRHLQG